MKSIEKEKIDKLTYIFFGIYMCTLFLSSTVIPFIFNILNIATKAIRYLCYIAFMLRILYDWKNGSKITLTMIFLIILSMLIYFFSKANEIFLLIFVLIALRNMNIDKLINIALKVFSIMFLCVILLALCNIIPDWTYHRGNLVRHSIGFYYPTTTIGMYLSIILMIFYTKRTNIKYIELLILELINFYLYKFTDGRLSFILITTILVTICLAKFKFMKKILNTKFIQKLFKAICYALPIVMLILTILITILYTMNNSFAVRINEILSGRFNLIAKAFENYGITFFGKEIDWNGWGGHGYIDLDEMEAFHYNYVDSSYARIFFDYGAIFSIVILIAYTITLVQKYKQKNYCAIITICFILIWSFIEPYIINIEKNIFVLLFIPLLSFKPIDELNYSNIKEKLIGKRKK